MRVVRADNKSITFDVTLRYWYDLGGRRTKVFNGTDTLRYSYGTDGNLAKIRVDWMGAGLPADSFLFTWDSLGRRDRVQYTNGTDVTFGYDRDGRLRMVCSKHPGGHTGVLDYLEQRLRYDQVNGDGLVVDMRRRQGMSEASTCGANTGNQPELYTASQYDGRHQLLTRSGQQAETYQYDASANLTASTVGVTQATFTPGATTNRLLSGVINSIPYTYFYDSLGNRVKDSTTNPLSGKRKFFYNAIGQLVGDSAFWDNGAGFQWMGSLNVFRYNAVGRRVKVSNNPSYYVAFDGPNVVRLRGGGRAWRYVHGPGVDDPLVAIDSVTGSWTKYYYLTDGRGRQLAFTDSQGYDYQSSLAYTQNGGNHAGGITNSNGYANARSETPEAPKLSSYRHRYYDQQSGRWTQEDPIGIGGGVNLYAYAGNNPATFTDPFGLKVCLRSSAKDPNVARREIARLKRGLERHTETTFDLDEGNCVTNVQPTGAGFNEIGARFYEISGNPDFTVTAQLGPCCSYMTGTRSLTVNFDVWEYMPYRSSRKGGCPITPNQHRTSATSTVWHEVGHIYEHLATGGTSDDSGNWGMHYENLWNRQNGRPERCGY